MLRSRFDAFLQVFLGGIGQHASRTIKLKRIIRHRHLKSSVRLYPKGGLQYRHSELKPTTQRGIIK